MLLPAFNESTAKRLEIICPGEHMTIEEAEKKLQSYCSQSLFDDDTWVVDNAFCDKNTNRNKKSIYFSQIKNEPLKNEVKLWILYRLMKRRSVSTLVDDVTHVSKLANCIDGNINSFDKITPAHVLNFYNLIFENSPEITLRGQLRDWYGVKTFANEMKLKTLKSCMNKYVVEQYPQNPKVDSKYIPDDVAIKMDIIMKLDTIPLAYRCVYWSLRLIPNRITEVLSLTTNCLKQIDEDTYMITFPTFKQAGSYYKGSVKMIELKYDGIGKFYIDLIKSQIEYTQGLNKNDQFLLYTPVYRMTKPNDKIKFSLMPGRELILLDSHDIWRFFKKVCTAYELKDESGNLVSLTSHQFRHNAITDRLTSGIFRPIEVMGLTAHHNTQMIEQSYTHRSAKDLSIENKKVVFRGRIINTDNDLQENAILKRPFAKRIYKLGVCSDVRECSHDKSQCLRCPYLIPNADELDYYQNEINDWQIKLDKANAVGNTDFAELCSYWIESYQILIERILKILTNENVDYNESEVSNNE